MFISILGYVAAVLTSIAFFPQVIKVVKTKNTVDISFYMYLCSITGITCWLIYGSLISDYAIVFANSLSLVLGIIILIYKIINMIKGEKP